MKKWEAQVSRWAAALAARYENLLIAGHSMGALFAFDAALAYPRQVRGLFLLAVPLKVSVRRPAVVHSLQTIFGRIPPGDSAAEATRAACSIRLSPKLWRYLPWIPRYLELFGKIRRTRKILPLARLPITAVQSGKDELVSSRVFSLLAACPQIERILLPGSGHFYYPQKDLETLLGAFDRFCREMA